ncbi:MAG: Dabb family protein [Clostridia bacterium]|nr:Dabb family protein [Clostridia bacterium]
MVRHVIVWTLKEDVDKEKVKADIKREIEGLVGKIDGLISLTVETNPLESSGADLMLDSTFESEKKLREYAENPLHVAVADGYVRPNVAVRSCFDFEIQKTGGIK